MAFAAEDPEPFSKRGASNVLKQSGMRAQEPALSSLDGQVVWPSIWVLHAGKNEETRLNSTVKQLLMSVLVITGVISLFIYVSKSVGGVKEQNVSYADMLNKAQASQVKDVMIDDRTATGHFTNNDAFRTTIPANDPEMYTIFRAHSVNISNKDQGSNYWLNILVSIAPFALLLGCGSSCCARCSPAATRP